MKRSGMILAAAVAMGVSIEASAQQRQFGIRPNRRPGIGAGAVMPGGIVNLPYQTTDNKGNQWLVYQNGGLRQNGPSPVYSQGGMLLVNGNYPQQSNNQGKIDEKTGELILENIPTPIGLTLTRRFSFQRDDGAVRIIDVLKNPGGQPVAANLQIQTNLNYGISVSQNLSDPKRKEQAIAWVGQTGAGSSVVEMFAGKGAKQAPTINFQPGNSMVQSTLNLTVPPGKEVAVMHLHLTVPSQEAGAEYVSKLKESKLLRDVPPALRKIIVNFAGNGQDFIGDIEILRGDLLDVVELRGGDQLKGTLKETTYKLQTFYGDVQLPVEKVIALINVGQFRPRQLVVTADGQIFGGKLSKETIELQLSSGQTTQVPLSQVTRVGYRRRSGEPEEWTFTKPTVLMRTGERVGVQMPTGPIEVVTRYGRLSLKPESVAGVVLQTEEHGVHEILLTDGSRFAGLLATDVFSMKLDAGGEQSVQFPASAVARLQLAGPAAEPADDTPTLDLVNDDLLVGSLSGDLKMDTAFDTITLNAAEIKSLVHPPENALDVQVMLWDGTTLSGQLQQPDVQCRLNSGVTIRVPVALIETYTQPQPRPSAQMADQIKKLVTDLNAEDWRARDRAEAQILATGPTAIGVLKELRETQPPEAKARIDGLLKKLEEQRKSQGTAPAPQPAPAIIDN